MLPLNRPLLRRSNRYIFPSDPTTDGYLTNPHVGLTGTASMSCHHLVPSSCVRPLATTAVPHLHFAQSPASHLMLLMEGPFMLFTLSSHLVLGLPRLLFPLISPSITTLSIPRSSLTTCPKYLKAACATFDSRVHSGLRPPAGRQMTILPMPLSQQPFNRS